MRFSSTLVSASTWRQLSAQIFDDGGFFGLAQRAGGDDLNLAGAALRATRVR